MGGALLGPFGRYELGTTVVTIGRFSSNSLVLNDGLVSGQHAEIRPNGTGYVLLDLGSTNGTMLNGQPLLPQVPQPLASGDRITIGDVDMMVELAAAGDPYAPTARLSTPVDIAFAPTQPVSAPPSPPLYGPEAAYAPPPLYPAPGVVIVQAPARQRSKKRTFFIVGGIVTALVVIICACVGVVLLFIASHSPEGVTKQYYSDMKSQNYADAYQLLTAFTQAQYDSEAQQNHLSSGQELFTKLFSCLDLQLGPVTDYTTSVLVQDKVHAIVSVNVTRSKERYTDQVSLFPESGGGWAIMSPSLPPNQHCT